MVFARSAHMTLRCGDGGNVKSFDRKCRGCYCSLWDSSWLEDSMFLRAPEEEITSEHPWTAQSIMKRDLVQDGLH